ncbi:UreF-domain-containing protein [Schizophyllum amplum]|uniref:UreF-domain-containing protein n=1 Tax=Schizophyllum amplum TaxID=97359 RepID=A0A550CTU8_9AGAR|nr:UreF-domain-containing protein [Auriculariopsis ampla]
MDTTDTETYLLLVLADSNLPTGSFVASSGMESYFKHGFDAHTLSGSGGSKQSKQDAAVLAFVRDSLASYARTALPFVADAHGVITRLAESATASGLANTMPTEPIPSCSASASSPDCDPLERTLADLAAADALCEAVTLNHVARRASRAQGVALLTLYAKGLAPPVDASTEANINDALLARALDQYKLLVRREDVPGHLPVCWGALTAALGLPLARAVHLHLFLHVRGLLSAAVRLNVVGPYAAQRLLLHAVRPIVETEVERWMERVRMESKGGEDASVVQTCACDSVAADALEDGPLNTWPLGEILAARHDLQHSRIFNS